MSSLVFSPYQQARSKWSDVAVVVFASLLLAFSAWMALPLGFTPVPIYLTVQLALFLPAFLGRRGAYATWLYVAQGAIGLPVFSHGGAGIGHLLGPTGGYIIGFALASYVVALFCERVEKTPSNIFGILLFGNALVFVFGLPHLALIVGSSKALMLGLYPFIGTDLLKLLIGCRILKSLKFFE